MRIAHVRTTSDAHGQLALCLRCGAAVQYSASATSGEWPRAAGKVKRFREQHAGCTWEHDSDQDAVAAAERAGVRNESAEAAE